MKMTYVSFAERRGKKEGKLEVARLLIKEKVSPSFIKRTTGLSLEKIKALLKEKRASH